MIETENLLSISIMDSVHYHDNYEIYVLVSGKQRYIIENEIYEMQKGDVAVIPEGVMHMTTKGLGGNRILISFDKSFLSTYLTGYAQEALLGFFDKRVLRPSGRDSEKIVDLATKIDMRVGEGDELGAFRDLVKLFFILDGCDAAEKSNGTKDGTLIRAIDYLSENFATITSLDDVAKATYVSKCYLCRTFGKELGVTYGKFLTKVRLKNARTMLVETRKSVLDVALDCGFSNSAYFIQLFKAHFGDTPAVYRKKHSS